MSAPHPTPLRPSSGQLRWQRHHQFGLFCHFGINTFNDREWSDGSLPSSSFAPTDFDARDWAFAAKEAGAAHLILTAKHHDGFCLWPTATTTYSVAFSPWRNGRGDVVAEVALACREAGIGFGVYLSPWDRHEPSWSTDHAAYDQLYLQQLTELCTGYGELFEIWFDGAGSSEHPYDWESIMQVVDAHQPGAMVFNMGRPTIRWIGNEDGLAEDPCWYTVDSSHHSLFDESASPAPDARYLPPECDVAIRRHWFWHANDLHTLKSRQHLEAIWYRSVGLGANLLLNVPPDTRGRLDSHDRNRLIEFGTTMRQRFSTGVTAELSQSGSIVTATFPEPIPFDHLWLEESIATGQTIRNHTVRLVDGIMLAGGHTVGSQRVHAMPLRTAQTLQIELDTFEGRLDRIVAYRTGVEGIPALEDQPEFDASRVD